MVLTDNGLENITTAVCLQARQALGRRSRGPRYWLALAAVFTVLQLLCAPSVAQSQRPSRLPRTARRTRMSSAATQPAALSLQNPPALNSPVSIAEDPLPSTSASMPLVVSPTAASPAPGPSNRREDLRASDESGSQAEFPGAAPLASVDAAQHEAGAAVQAGPGVAMTTMPADSPAAAITPPAMPLQGTDSGSNGSVQPQDGDLRLVARVDVNGFATGGVQVFRNGGFGAVCAQDFGNRDAMVACRQLGFPSGTVLRAAFPSKGSGDDFGIAEPFLAPFVLSALGCTGGEDRLVECPLALRPDYPDEDHEYSSPEECMSIGPLNGPSFAAVACGFGTEADEGDLRLADGVTSDNGSAQFGRLEVYSQGGWGTVCGAAGNEADGLQALLSVCCRQLGFSTAVIAAGRVDFLPAEQEDSDSIFRRIPTADLEVACSGTESSLAQCPLAGADSSGRIVYRPCFHLFDVTLTCSNGPTDMDGSVRLAQGAAGPGFEYGRLEVFVNGLWSDICSDTQFTPNSAAVACHQLGYDGGSRLFFNVPFQEQLYTVHPESRPVALAEVHCVGNETSLLDCPSASGMDARCPNSTDAAIVACGNTDPGCNVTSLAEEGAVRLVGGFGTPCDSIHTGTVEIFHAGEWGGICVEAASLRIPVDLLAADTICRQLGFPHGNVVSSVIPGPTPLFLDTYYGPLDDLVESEASGRVWLNGLQCFGNEGNVLDCRLDPPEFLTDIEECHRDMFRGTVFGDATTRLEVACRQFPVEGAEEAIVTPGAVEGDVRLTDQVALNEWAIGTPEVFFEGSWHQVCSTQFDVRDAVVACRQLGLGAATLPADVIPLPEGPTFVPGGRERERRRFIEPDVVAARPGCIGTEEKLLDCPVEDVRFNDYGEAVSGFVCTRRSFQSTARAGLAVACVSQPVPGEELDLRLGAPLTEVDGGMAGTLEVFHSGAWGSVCSATSFGDDYSPSTEAATAQVACRQLGFRTGSIRLFGSSKAAAEVTPHWLQELVCTGSESSVQQCQRTDFGDVSDCSGLVVRLICGNTDDGLARLEGGAVEPTGAWEYGRLEESINGVWVPQGDSRSGDSEVNATQASEACLSLGYAAGAQMLGNEVSPFPGSTIFEDGFGQRNFVNDVVLMCSNPSGCQVAETAPPREGDVRLIPVTSAGTPTAACDPVHFGGIEVFINGRWARICNGDFRQNEGDLFHPVAAQVVCRQLGFDFGSLMDADSEDTFEYGSLDYGYFRDGVPVAANFVKCSGLEERISDCVFADYALEDFATFDAIKNDDSNRGVCSVEITAMLSVVCRQFPIVGSNVIR